VNGARLHGREFGYAGKIIADGDENEELAEFILRAHGIAGFCDPGDVLL
jgi:hypothetical protein